MDFLNADYLNKLIDVIYNQRIVVLPVFVRFWVLRVPLTDPVEGINVKVFGKYLKFDDQPWALEVPPA